MDSILGFRLSKLEVRELMDLRLSVRYFSLNSCSILKENFIFYVFPGAAVRDCFPDPLRSGVLSVDISSTTTPPSSSVSRFSRSLGIYPTARVPFD